MPRPDLPGLSAPFFRLTVSTLAIPTDSSRLKAPTLGHVPPRELPSMFGRYRLQLGEAIGAGLERTAEVSTMPGQTDVYSLLRYGMGRADSNGRRIQTVTGKEMRPTLCLFACQATGGNPARALPAAIALEYIHNFSLIHDDIQDGDETRHHRPTIWSIWGIPEGNLCRECPQDSGRPVAFR